MALKTEILRFGGAVLVIPLIAITLGLVLLVGRTDVAEVNPDRPSDGGGGLEYRLAEAIAFRQGLVRLASPAEARMIDVARAESDGRDPPGESDPAPAAFVLVISECGSGRVPAAIAAVESYLRPTWVRLFEHDMAQTLQTVFGLRPDWSYGPAQIRLSTARRILQAATDRLLSHGMTVAPAIDDDTLFAAITDTCAAQELVALASAAGGGDPVSVPELALRHLGGSPIPTLPGQVTYPGVVNTLASEVLELAEENFRTLTEQSKEDEAAEQEEPETRNTPAPIPLTGLRPTDGVPLYCLNWPIRRKEFAIRTNFGKRLEDWPFQDAPPARLEIGLVGVAMQQPEASRSEMLDLLVMAQTYRAEFDPAGKAPLTFFSLMPGHKLYPLARTNGCAAVLMDPR